MSVPSLAYQIAAAASIVLCSTEMSDEAVSYRVQEIWKASAGSFKAGESLRLDTGMHQLLGYRPVNGQEVVLFFVAKGLPPGQPLEILPVVDGAITYAPHDKSVQERLALAELRERAAGLSIPLKVSFIGLKSVRAVAVAHNNFAPVLVLFEDHLVQRVIFRKTRKYSEIEYVDVSSTDTDNLDIAYTDSWFTFSCKLEANQDLVKALKLFARKGVRLGDGAKRLLSEVS